MGVLFAEGEYFVRKLLGKMNAESENKPPSKFHFLLYFFLMVLLLARLKTEQWNRPIRGYINLTKSLQGKFVLILFVWAPYLLKSRLLI